MPLTPNYQDQQMVQSGLHSGTYKGETGMFTRDTNYVIGENPKSVLKRPSDFRMQHNAYDCI